MPSAFLSSMYLTAAFAAKRPSVKDPEENLWALPPTVSPAPKDRQLLTFCYNPRNILVAINLQVH